MVKRINRENGAPISAKHPPENSGLRNCPPSPLGRYSSELLTLNNRLHRVLSIRLTCAVRSAKTLFEGGSGMKILGLCFLILVGIAPLFGQETPKNDQVPARATRLAARSSDSPVVPVGPHYFAPDQINLDGFSNATCAYLRTYRVKRQYHGSDLVSPAGYTTCVPTRRFEMKSAVQVQSEPDPRD